MYICIKSSHHILQIYYILYVNSTSINLSGEGEWASCLVPHLRGRASSQYYIIKYDLHPGFSITVFFFIKLKEFSSISCFAMNFFFGGGLVACLLKSEMDVIYCQIISFIILIEVIIRFHVLVQFTNIIICSELFPNVNPTLHSKSS